VEPCLALPVVAASPRLQDRRQTTDGLDRGVESLPVVDRGEGRGGDAEATEGLLLGEAVLRYAEERLRLRSRRKLSLRMPSHTDLSRS